jgi:hypothetical protein
MDHNTRLWVSIDSPHLGANIPMGLQSLLNQIKDDVPAANDFVVDQLGSVAAKQQLIEQFHSASSYQLNTSYLDGKTEEQGFLVDRGHPFYIEYYNNLFTNGLAESKGYPQNLRKIALVNGALKNTKVYYNPFTAQLDNYINNGEIGFNVRGFQTFCTPWPFCWDEHVASLEAYTMPSLNENLRISKYKNGFSNISLRITNINSRGNMDNVQGGWFPGFNELAKSVEGNDDPFPYISSPFWSWHTLSLSNVWALLSDLLGGAELSLYNNEHVNSFIPTFSSLGFYQPETVWSENLDRDLTCTNEIPFDTYFGPENNEQHTSFTQESVDWLLEELAGNEQLPTVYKTNNADFVTGSNRICLNDNAFFNFIDLCPVNEGVTWEVSSNLEIVVGGWDYLLVEPQDGLGEFYSNSGYVRAILDGVVYQRNIWVGIPDSEQNSITGSDHVHVGSTNDYEVEPISGADYYRWSLPAPFDPDFDIVPIIDPTSDNWQIKEQFSQSRHLDDVFSGNAGHEGHVEAWGVSACGESRYSQEMYVTQYNGGPCVTCYDPIQIVPIPNSANQEFKLHFEEHPPGTYYIYIYDANSIIKYQGQTTNVEKTIHTENLPNGTYFLHVYDGDSVKSQQLLVQH